MSVQRVAVRYAKSLIELANEMGKLERIQEDMLRFSTMLEVSHEFELLVKSPVVNADAKKRVFEALLKADSDEMTMQFFQIVLRKGRESYLPEIAQAFLEQYKVIKGISTVYLRSAVKLSDEVMGIIRQKLAEGDLARQHIELVTETDPSLIGGFVLRYGDKLYDASVAWQLKKLTEEIAGRS